MVFTVLLLYTPHQPLRCIFPLPPFHQRHSGFQAPPQTLCSLPTMVLMCHLPLLTLGVVPAKRLLQLLPRRTPGRIESEISRRTKSSPQQRQCYCYGRSPVCCLRSKGEPMRGLQVYCHHRAAGWNLAWVVARGPWRWGWQQQRLVVCCHVWCGAFHWAAVVTRREGRKPSRIAMMSPEVRHEEADSGASCTRFVRVGAGNESGGSGG